MKKIEALLIKMLLRICWGSHVLARLEIPKDETTSTTFRPQDLALLGPERDLSMIVKGICL